MKTPIKATIELIETMTEGMKTFVPAKGTIMVAPKVGDPLVFNSKEMYGRGFITSPVTEIVVDDENECTFRTKNSLYKISKFEEYNPELPADMPEIPLDAKLSTL